MNPGGRCPYCNEGLTFTRRGKQYCHHCRGPIDVKIDTWLREDFSDDGKGNVSTRIIATDEQRLRRMEGQKG